MATATSTSTATTETSETSETEMTFETIDQTLELYIKEIDTKLKEIKSILPKIRGLKKDIKNMELKLKKNDDKKKKKSSNKLTGFLMPVLISKELVAFFIDNLSEPLQSHYWIDDESDDKKVRERKEKIRKELPSLLETVKALKGDGQDKIARTDVTKLLTRYVQYHNLQDTTEKVCIKLNNTESSNKFKALLSDVDPSDKLKFINMQKYIKHHFFTKKYNGFPPKTSESASATTSAPPTPTTTSSKSGKSKSTRRIKRTPVAAV